MIQHVCPDSPVKPQFLHQEGFSLVELIVAVVIMSLVAISIVATLNQGIAIDVVEKHRRKARAVLDSCFESQRLNHDKYSQINPGTYTIPNMILDWREPGSSDDLYGSLTVSVVSLNVVSDDGKFVDGKEITLKMEWMEPSMPAQSLILTKIVTHLL